MPDWNQVFEEIKDHQVLHRRLAAETVDIIRRRYLKQLFEHTGRNVIAYYSGWLSKPDAQGIEITDEDKNGIMMAVHGLDRALGLDLIIHTPGGSLSATESIVDYLHKMFGNNVRAIVPQIAMSAGTMIACSCRSIVMGKHSNLGPIDPQLRGVAAHGVLLEFERAIKECAADPAKIPIWQVIIGKYHPTFLSECENAIKWADNFVRTQLAGVMFKGKKSAAGRAAEVVKRLTDYRNNMAHDRHIHAEECKNIGLRIEDLEADPQTQDMVLTVHHCYVHTLQNTGCYKIIENHNGAAVAKQAQQSIQQLPQIQLVPA